MVSQVQQTKLIIQAVSRGFKDVEKQLADTNKRLDETATKGKASSKGIGALGSAFGGLGSILATLGLGVTVKQLGEFVVSSTLLAARVETLSVVTQTLGHNAGYTKQEIIDLERAIQDKGITTQASRQSLALMMQAELDLADATDLARLAQDAAVIAGINSSEAFTRLIHVITSGNVIMARRMGLQVNFNKGYQDLAERLGITSEQLTASEKAQERLNIVMEEGTQIAGAYENAMESVGKQVESTPRYWEEYKVAIGETGIGLLGYANTLTQKVLKAETERLHMLKAMKDAVEINILTNREYQTITDDLLEGLITEEEVLSKMVAMLDEYTLRREFANEEDRMAIGMMEVLTQEIEEASTAYEDGIQSLNKYSTASMGAAAISKILGEYMADGFVSESEKQDIIDYAEAWGIKLPAAFFDAMNNFNVMQGDMEEGMDVLMTKAAEYAARLRNAARIEADLGIGADVAGKWTAPKYKPQAGGGKLADVAVVGEKGYELIIDGYVIPHELSKLILEGSGMAPATFAEGGDLSGGSMYNITPEWLDVYKAAYYGTGKTGKPKGAGEAAKTVEVDVTPSTMDTMTSSASMQAEISTERLAATLSREMSRGQKENADLLRMNNRLLARLATAEDIIGGFDSSVGNLL